MILFVSRIDIMSLPTMILQSSVSVSTQKGFINSLHAMKDVELFIQAKNKNSHIILLCLCLHLNSEFTANEGQKKLKPTL